MSHSLSEVVLERSIGTYRKTPGFSQLQCMALDDAGGGIDFSMLWLNLPARSATTD
jgi:hypothetical protein